MTNKPINEVIAEIKQTKGNRKYCSGLHQSLESDGYVKNIYNWARVTTPARIDALIDHIAALEQQLAETKLAFKVRCDLHDATKQQLASSASHADNFEKKMWHYHQLAETECERANAAEQQLAAERADKRRMDWLVSHYVEVRTPLVYGSHALFVAQCVSGDWEEHATSLREQIDAAMKVEGE